MDNKDFNEFIEKLTLAPEGTKKRDEQDRQAEYAMAEQLKLRFGLANTKK